MRNRRGICDEKKKKIKEREQAFTVSVGACGCFWKGCRDYGKSKVCDRSEGGTSRTHLPEGQTMVLCILLLVGKSRMHKERVLVPGAGETREAEV